MNTDYVVKGTSYNYWSYALLILGNKGKVHRRSWKKDQYIESLNGKQLVYHNITLHVDDFDAADWEVYTPTYTLNDMKDGQKFRCKKYHGANEIFMKFSIPNHLKSNKDYQEYINIATGEFWNSHPHDVKSFVVEPITT